MAVVVTVSLSFGHLTGTEHGQRVLPHFLRSRRGGQLGEQVFQTAGVVGSQQKRQIVAAPDAPTAPSAFHPVSDFDKIEETVWEHIMKNLIGIHIEINIEKIIEIIIGKEKDILLIIIINMINMIIDIMIDMKKVEANIMIKDTKVEAKKNIIVEVGAEKVIVETIIINLNLIIIILIIEIIAEKKSQKNQRKETIKKKEDVLEKDLDQTQF